MSSLPIHDFNQLLYTVTYLGGNGNNMRWLPIGSNKYKLKNMIMPFWKPKWQKIFGFNKQMERISPKKFSFFKKCFVHFKNFFLNFATGGIVLHIFTEKRKT